MPVIDSKQFDFQRKSELRHRDDGLINVVTMVT